MHRISFFALFGLFSLLFAQDQPTSLRNAIGWESGISYRRYVSPKSWLSATVNGNIQDNTGSDTTYRVSHWIQPDSIVTEEMIGSDSTRYYSGTFKVSAGRELVRVKAVGLDLFFSGAYTYSNRRRRDSGANSSHVSAPAHAIAGSIGLDPKVWVLERISIGSQLGLMYTYSFSRSSDTQGYTNDYSSDEYTRDAYVSSHTVRLFGGFSLDMGLNVFFYF